MKGAYIYRISILLLCTTGSLFLWVDNLLMMKSDYENTQGTYEQHDLELARINFQLASIIDLSEVTSRPLFVPGRRFVESEAAPPEEAPKEVEPEKPFEVTVTGVVGDGETFMTVFRNKKTKEENTVYSGAKLPDDYSDWSVDSANNEKVVVKKDSDNVNDKASVEDYVKKELFLSNEEKHYTIEE